MSNTMVLRPVWSPLNIALMILGFIIFWPLGLAMLAYILWGDRFQDVSQDAKSQFRGMCARMRDGPVHRTGNVAFDEYREKEVKRLEEERRKLDEMRDEFDTFLRELRRAKDQGEFDRFMKSHNARKNAEDAETI